MAITSYAVSMFREQLDFDPMDVLLKSASTGTQRHAQAHMHRRICNTHPHTPYQLTPVSLCAPDRSHWSDSESRWFTLEATGYALLALVKSGHMEEAAAAFNWLNDKRGFGGSFGPTQVARITMESAKRTVLVQISKVFFQLSLITQM